MVSRVEQAPIFDSTTWLNWLVSVAVRADELVAIPINREYFWRMLRDWDAEHGRRGPQSPVTRGYVPYNAVAILPRRRLSLFHKVAVVAAIHDAICDKTKRIDPWAAHKRLRSVGLVRAKAGIAYAVLCSEVRNLTEDDRERIEKALSDVEADLAAKLADTNGRDHTDARRGPTKVRTANRHAITLRILACKLCKSKDAIRKAMNIDPGAPKPVVKGKSGQTNLYDWRAMRVWARRNCGINIGEPDKSAIDRGKMAVESVGKRRKAR